MWYSYNSSKTYKEEIALEFKKHSMERLELFCKIVLGEIAKIEFDVERDLVQLLKMERMSSQQSIAERVGLRTKAMVVHLAKGDEKLYTTMDFPSVVSSYVKELEDGITEQTGSEFAGAMLGQLTGKLMLPIFVKIELQTATVIPDQAEMDEWIKAIVALAREKSISPEKILDNQNLTDLLLVRKFGNKDAYVTFASKVTEVSIGALMAIKPLLGGEIVSSMTKSEEDTQSVNNWSESLGTPEFRQKMIQRVEERAAVLFSSDH